MSTLKSLTKAELVALVQQRNTEIAGLRMQLSIAQRNAPTTAHSLPAHFAAARDLAMRMGRSVKVEA
jgi:hypothetical protein